MSSNLEIQPVTYRAPFWARNRHVQSLLATFKWRKKSLKKRAQLLLESSEEVILECSDGVKLQSFFSPQKDTTGAVNVDAPLAILIHGWEGSHESLYLLSSAHALYSAGYSVVRLNLRDHGDSHHLNTELFHSNRLDEVVSAISEIQKRYNPTKMHLCGFSLGGNFALRVAAEAPKHGIKLHNVVAICPALDPKDILHQLETGLSIYMKYFMIKWHRSLRKKQAAHPELYDLESTIADQSMRELTHTLISFYGDYPSVDDYFLGYTITGERLANLEIPCHALLSEDDPIISYQDIHQVAPSTNLKLYHSKHGGHCGFIKNGKLHSWLDDFIVESIAKD